MKVAQVGIGIVAVPPPEEIAAGREQYIYWLAEYLGRQGCVVHVLDIKAEGKQKEKREQSSAKYHDIRRLLVLPSYNLPFVRDFGGHVVFALQEFLFGLSALIPIFRLIKKERIDIIHTHQRGAALFAVIANRLRQSPAVVVYTPQLSTKVNTWLRKIAHADEIIALKSVEHIISLTPAYKELLVSEYGINSNKITPIHVGTALDEIKQFLAQKQGTCHQGKMALCVGSIIPRKNQITAVKAIAKVVKTHPDAKLVLAGPIGDTTYLDSIKNFIIENGLDHYVEIKGSVTKKELYTLYSEANLFLFPTTNEVQPTVVMEAMAFGLPVVASNIGSNAEVIKHKPESAILIDPHNVDEIASVVLRLFDDNDLWHKMSQSALELAETLSYNNVASETIALFNKLAKYKKLSTREKICM